MKNLEAAVTLHLEFLRVQKHFKKNVYSFGVHLNVKQYSVLCTGTVPQSAVKCVMKVHLHAPYPHTL